MDMSDLPGALNAPDNSAVRLALGRILTASGLQPATLTPELYDPANREVLDLIRAGVNADAITRAWERLHPSPMAQLLAGEVAATPQQDPPFIQTGQLATAAEHDAAIAAQLPPGGAAPDQQVVVDTSGPSSAGFLTPVPPPPAAPSVMPVDAVAVPLPPVPVPPLPAEEPGPKALPDWTLREFFAALTAEGR